MMRTIKKRLSPWKILLAACTIPVAFFMIACQDQLAASQPSMHTEIPIEVQQKYNELKIANPDKKYLLMETDEKMIPKLDEMKKKYASLDQAQITHIETITPSVPSSEDVRTFAIVEYVDKSIHSKDFGDDIYTIVDETAQPVGGMESFYQYIARELRYPKEARINGIQGKVLITFIVDTDGNINVTGVSGIGAGCELEAMRVMQSSPKWIPGKNKGIAVRQELTLPIVFRLNGSTKNDERPSPVDAMQEMVVVGEQ